MHLRTLHLEEFRSYRRQDLTFEAAGLGLIGQNASGKSTLLEAISMLATTRSPRTTSERETINWESGRSLGFPPFARIYGSVVRADETFEIEIGLQTDTESSGLKKQIKVNGRPVRAMDAVGILKAVLFSPEDVALVAGSPSGRRRYLDLTISQLDGRYLRALSRYNRLLTQRNSLLKALARDGVSPTSPIAGSQLAYWDEELIAYGSQIVARRLTTTARLALLASQRFEWLTGATDLAFTYRPNVDVGSLADDGARQADDVHAVVARSFAQQVEEARRDELKRGVSLIGPHRDDATFSLGDVDLGTFGSRGQQRLAVVALKLAEADLMEEEAGERPVVLLDDVLSELDARHRTMLTTAIAPAGTQVFITVTDRALLEASDLAGLPLAEAVAGEIRIG